MKKTTILFRPVGPLELALIQRTDCREFPPRLEEQPIFYPVLTREYAEQIARDWNSKSASTGHVGYVTRFAVEAAFLAPNKSGAPCISSIGFRRRNSPSSTGISWVISKSWPSTMMAKMSQCLMAAVSLFPERSVRSLE